VAGGLALMWHLHVRTEAALQRGDDLMGRWRVDAAAWRAFVELEQRFAREPGAWPNEFTPRRDVPAEGVEVTIGAIGVVVDGSVHRLPRHGLPELTGARLRHDAGAPASIELHLYYPPATYGDRFHPARRTTLRFPVAAEAGGTADRTAERAAKRAAERYVEWCTRGRPGEAGFFHGRGDGSNPDDLSTCRACGWQTHKFISRCERCGGSLLSRRWARRFGVLLIVLGAALCGGIGFLLWQLAGPLLHPGQTAGGLRFSGSRATALVVWTVLGGVGAFGLAALVNGVWQVATGRRHPRMIQVALGLAGLSIAAAMLLTLMG